MWLIRHFTKFKKVIKYYQKKKKNLKSKWISPTHAWMHIQLCSWACNVFRVQLYKNNAHTLQLLLHILSIIISNWLQHVHSAHVVYECILITSRFLQTQLCWSHITQYCCGYCKLKYCWGYVLGVCCRYCMHSSSCYSRCSVPSVYSQWYFNLQ